MAWVCDQLSVKKRKKLAIVQSWETMAAAWNAHILKCHFSSRCKLNQLITLHYPNATALITGTWKRPEGSHTHTSFGLSTQTPVWTSMCVIVQVWMHTQKYPYDPYMWSGAHKNFLTNKHVCLLNQIFLDKGAEKQHGVSLMLLTAQESVMRRLIILWLWVRLLTQLGWVTPPAEHNGHELHRLNSTDLCAISHKSQARSGMWLPWREHQLAGIPKLVFTNLHPQFAFPLSLSLANCWPWGRFRERKTSILKHDDEAGNKVCR